VQGVLLAAQVSSTKYGKGLGGNAHGRPHPKGVSKILGHASITMTLDRYSHWIPSMGRHAKNAMPTTIHTNHQTPEPGLVCLMLPETSLVSTQIRERVSVDKGPTPLPAWR
jgi:hypothetical protein